MLVDRRSHRVQLAAAIVHEFAACGLHDFLDSVGHVLGHLPLVLADLVVDLRQRHSVPIHVRGLRGDSIVRVGEDLAEGVNLEPGGMAALDFFLQCGAESRNLLRAPVRAGRAGAGVPELRAEAAQVIALPAGAMVEPRHVDVLAADAAVVSRRRAGEDREEAGRVQPNLLAQIAANHVRSVAEPIRMPLRLRVEQQPRRIHTAGAHDDDLRQRLTFRPGVSIEILHAAGEPVLVGEDAPGHRIRADLEPAGPDGIGKQMVRRAEKRCRVAPLAAIAAIVTGREAARPPGHVGAASRDDRNADLVHPFFEQTLAAARRRRWLQELAPRQHL